MSRRTRRNEGSSGNEESEESEALRAMRVRSRAVAEREASRLARPAAAGTLGHVSKGKSARMSTPFGSMMDRKLSSPTSGASAVQQEEWCGPFSVARQMIAAREEARRLREEQQAAEDPDNPNKPSHPLDFFTEQALLAKKRKENPSLLWVPSTTDAPDSGNSTNYYAKRRKRVSRMKSLMGNGQHYVPSLFQLCVNYIADNFDHVESLGLVDHSIRVSLCERLVAKGKMTGAAFDTVTEKGIEILELVDCAQVTQEQFCERLKVLLPSGLRAILLKHCGRCFGSQAVEVITEMKKEDVQLFALSLSGAYLLKDVDIAAFISSTSRTLSSIDLTAAPLIGNKFCQAIGEHYSSVGLGGGSLLELSLQNIPLSKEALLSLGAGSDALRHLKNLKLTEIDAIDDEVVSIILDSASLGTLEGLDLSGNSQLTDDILSSIRRCNSDGSLRALQLSGLTNLTAIGLEALFTPLDDLPPPPMLKKLDLSSCSYNQVNDAVITLVAKAASFKRSVSAAPSMNEDDPNPELITHKITPMKGLVHVNISGSSITDKSLEVLSATCSSSLEELDVSFCTAVSDKGLGYLVSKVKTQFQKVHVWGLAQLTDEFFDGHSSNSLEVIGVWMKRSGGRSLR